MSASSDSTGGSHSFEEFILVLPRFFAGQFHLDVNGFAIRDSVAENIRFTMLTDIYDGSVFRVELTNRVVSCHTAVLAQGGDDLILEFSLGVQRQPPLSKIVIRPCMAPLLSPARICPFSVRY
ncbi:MAG: hypothetical protein J6S05_05640 [Bacteroidaceae bacterium]|nr:hypothetical protein [Bacteroidaceae bacterium]